MRVLLVLKQDRNLAAFGETVRELLARGHEVRLAVQERDDARDERLRQTFASPGFAVVRSPAVRTDEFAPQAALVRALRDAVHYERPQFRATPQLHERIIKRLWQQLPVPAGPEGLTAALAAVQGEQVRHLESVLASAEQALPPAALFTEFLSQEQPDLLLVSPLVHFASPQTDLVSSARVLGIPVVMLLYSWDNLSTKGSLHRLPDWMVVWNERQRQEAVEMHGFPASQVVVAGAPRFDAFFALQSQLTRQEFHEPLGLDPDRATILYLCSSRIICDDELSFLRDWLAAVRGAGHQALREANVVIRPHPDVELLPDGPPLERHTWPAQPGLGAHRARPFDDPRVVVLRTAYHTPQGLYESIAQSTVVVGLNTTAELEAGVVGRPVFSIQPSAVAGAGQNDTIHFHYLTRPHGGFVDVASSLSLHVEQVGAAVESGCDPAPIQRFIEGFLRPHGLDRPVAPILASAIERLAAGQRPAAVESPVQTSPVAEAVEDGELLTLVGGIPRVRLRPSDTALRRARSGVVTPDKETARWLHADVSLGEVLYDIGAGAGVYTLIAAKRRGAVVVAFEAGSAAYAALCDNLFLNVCELSVMAVPAALGAADGAGEIKFPGGQQGGERYSVVDTEWRVRPSEARRPLVQPICLSALDTVRITHGLAAPNHVRIAPRLDAVAILRGAAETVGLSSLKSVCVCVPLADYATIEDQLAKVALTVRRRHVQDSFVHLVFGRSDEPAEASR